MDRRMAGDYEVIHAFHIGDKEIVIGENIEADDDERYMCAFCEKNEIMERYSGTYFEQWSVDNQDLVWINAVDGSIIGET